MVDREKYQGPEDQEQEETVSEESSLVAWVEGSHFCRDGTDNRNEVTPVQRSRHCEVRGDLLGKERRQMFKDCAGRLWELEIRILPSGESLSCPRKDRQTCR